ncbi:MAG: TIGR03767 family metallophosphoesterase [Actinomycetota bacterium]|nr:TIGR03767 family metallophosphoesterase [Actinomycetota bacterium]
MDLTRRDFLKATSTVAAATMLPDWWRYAYARPSRSTSLELTTLGRTIAKGAKLGEGSQGAYLRLIEGPGEPHLLRDELTSRPPGGNAGGKRRRSLLNIAHFTDIHLIDAQSPARVEWLDRYSDQQCSQIPFSSAHRAQETLTTQVLEAMIRQIRRIKVSPVTGAALSSVVCTGDNIDNEQLNELRWFIDLMDGGKKIVPDSGELGLYEGVQSATWGDVEYWHPDEGIADKYKQQWGFPEYPGMLEDALRPFTAIGTGIPWYQTFGNHDGLMQGTVPRNQVFEAFAVGSTKIEGLPPGVQPCDGFETLRDNPTAFLAAPAQRVAADAQRKIVARQEYIDEMFRTTGSPAGHGFTQANLESGVAYWSTDAHPGFRFIGLDTVNPGGYDDGSIGEAQLTWLEEQLIGASRRYYDADGAEKSAPNKDRYVVLFSHHGLRSLENPGKDVPDVLHPEQNDQPRYLAPEVEALIHRFPNVIAWVNGHSHLNVIEPRKSPYRKNGGFWDIGTAAHIDWSCQSRLVEVVDNRDGTLSIFCTMVDHAAPVRPGGSDPVLKLASMSRELAANDYQRKGGEGEAKDRNVELLIEAPFSASAARGPQKRAIAVPVSL